MRLTHPVNKPKLRDNVCTHSWRLWQCHENITKRLSLKHFLQPEARKTPQKQSQGEMRHTVKCWPWKWRVLSLSVSPASEELHFLVNCWLWQDHTLEESITGRIPGWECGRRLRGWMLKVDRDCENSKLCTRFSSLSFNTQNKGNHGKILGKGVTCKYLCF